MDETKITKIKKAIQSNFDASPAQYQIFEERHGFFRRLTETLLRRLDLQANSEVLDIGCGTGASCLQILSAVPGSRVWGLDNSPAMLSAARSCVEESERLTFIEGDAARLRDYFHFKFDSIIYSASIFLIPDYRQSLEHARSLLKPGGSVGLTFMDGPYDSENNHLLEMTEKVVKQGLSLKRPVDWGEFESFFGQIFPKPESWIENFRLQAEVLREFYSIPAMSAGLFPAIDYPERVKKVGLIFDHISQTEINVRWRVMVGRLEN
jgi:ubiquinone/menaquinone biosynthesis C-methylase UbiE